MKCRLGVLPAITRVAAIWLESMSALSFRLFCHPDASGLEVTSFIGHRESAERSAGLFEVLEWQKICVSNNNL